MKYSHIIGISLISLVAVVGLGESGVVPYSFSMPIVGVAGFLAIVYFFDPDFLNGSTSFGGNKGRDLVVEPNDALNYLQEKNKEIPGHRKLDLDRTSTKNMQLHTARLTVNENGEKKTKYGVVGRPVDQHDKESIAYIVHCDEGDVEYDGERHTAEERKNPFYGTKWVENAGYKAQVQDEDQGKPTTQFNIHQGGSEVEQN